MDSRDLKKYRSLEVPYLQAVDKFRRYNLNGPELVTIEGEEHGASFTLPVFDWLSFKSNKPVMKDQVNEKCSYLNLLSPVNPWQL